MLVAKNVAFYETGWTRRTGITLVGATGSSNVNALGVIKKDTGDILVRCYGTTFQKLVAGTWTTVGGVTMSNIKSTIVSYLDADMTTAALKTGTAKSTSTNRSLDITNPPDTAMTLNAFA